MKRCFIISVQSAERRVQNAEFRGTLPKRQVFTRRYNEESASIHGISQFIKKTKSLSTKKQPSLCRVAVALFYLNMYRKGENTYMKC